MVYAVPALPHTVRCAHSPDAYRSVHHYPPRSGPRGWIDILGSHTFGRLALPGPLHTVHRTATTLRRGTVV